ncbi:helix-turn-helix domain-containing protein [Gluconobacter kondonii]|uniref:helix-turn-helix domain-containing protein n=1 Tax=Gluconobacter kondonii TaxID=941463 RepID=UPI001B8ABF06|nr:helix-turn-helix domain-containing protein [Gluconobacter kondonii]MBS1058206.1 helix-turn-helix domain-containing protein [Gluconobacter kondonii]
MNKKTETQVSDGQSSDYLLELGNRLKEVREGKDMNVMSLCFTTDLSVGTISNIERGKNASYVTLHKILSALKISAQQILPRDDHEVIPIDAETTSGEIEKYQELIRAYGKVAEPLKSLIDTMDRLSRNENDSEPSAAEAPADPREPALIELGDRIRDIRLARKLTVADLALASKNNASVIQLLEVGFRNPSVEFLKRIAAALQVEMADLFPGLPGQHESFNALRVLGLYSCLQSAREQISLFQMHFNAFEKINKASIN